MGRSHGGPTQRTQQPPTGQPQGQSQGGRGQPQSLPPAPQSQSRSVGTGRGAPTGGTRPGRTSLGPAPLEPVSIEDVARTDVVTAERDDSVETVLEDMARNNVGSVVVVEDGRAVGILTDRTVALSLRDTPDVGDRTAEDLMTENLATASLDADAFEVLDRMSDEGIRRIPIVSDDGELRGIVTLDDVLLFLEDNLHTVAETVREQFPDL